jgi:hypothetical protein
MTFVHANRPKNWMVLPLSVVIAALLAGGGGYGAAWWQGQSEAARLEAQLAEAAAEAEADRESAAAALTEATAAGASFQREIGVLQARRRLHLALDALEHQNFGVAHQLLQGAAGLLSENADNRTELPELSGDLSETLVVVTPEIHDQLEVVRGFVRRLEDVLTPIDLGPSAGGVSASGASEE